eukprot:SAG11_NODE_27586_length_331_cov_0.668103_1_plen_91_part_00
MRSLQLRVLAMASVTAANAQHNHERLLLSSAPVTGCSSFWDLRFDPWQFDRYGEFFDANSTFSLYPAGVFTGPGAVREDVKFASDESPFV